MSANPKISTVIDAEGRDIFVHSRNAMAKALLDAGVDPLITGTVMSNLEEMGFYMLRLNTRLSRVEAELKSMKSAPVLAG